MSKPLFRSAKAPRKVKTVITGARIAFGQIDDPGEEFPEEHPAHEKGRLRKHNACKDRVRQGALQKEPRAGLNALNDERGHENRACDRSGDAQGKGGNQVADDTGPLADFRRYQTARRSFPELVAFFGVFLFHKIGSNSRKRDAQSRQDADKPAHRPGAKQGQGPLDDFGKAGEDAVLHLDRFGDRAPLFKHDQHLGKGEDAEGGDDDGNPCLQGKNAA